jgi:hypothetical protein
MSEPWGGPGAARRMASPEGTVVFLLTDSGVLMQGGGAELWHAVEPAPGGGPEPPTAAQLRALARERAKRQHPAGSGRRGGPGNPAGGHRGVAPMEIYDPLTGAWSPLPPGPGPARVAEALCWVLPDGRCLIGGVASRTYSTYDPASQQWSTARRPGPGRPGNPRSVRCTADTDPVVVVRLTR